ncbi:MAG: DUF3179 domain-containing protein [Cyanobacteria bacterium P01_H01_bin.15]
MFKLNAFWLGPFLLGTTALAGIGLSAVQQSRTFVRWLGLESSHPLQAQEYQNAIAIRIDPDELFNGGPPMNGIPSIDEPTFVKAGESEFNEHAQVVGVVINGEAKAYPLGILNWHEIVNDTVGGQSVSVTYCPLCDTAIAFERRNDTTFGVSGKLYQSCLVMYDRQDHSLFAQPWGLGIIGEQINRTLPRLPLVKTTLGAWLKRYPQSLVLSTDTGFIRDYTQDPYQGYRVDQRIVFPVRNQTALSVSPKAPLLYIWESDQQTPYNQFSGASLAFEPAAIAERGQHVLSFQGRPLYLRWDEGLQTVHAERPNGRRLAVATAYGFVYPAFFGQDAPIYPASQAQPSDP